MLIHTMLIQLRGMKAWLATHVILHSKVPLPRSGDALQQLPSPCNDTSLPGASGTRQ